MELFFICDKDQVTLNSSLQSNILMEDDPAREVHGSVEVHLVDDCAMETGCVTRCTIPVDLCSTYVFEPTTSLTDELFFLVAQG